MRQFRSAFFLVVAVLVSVPAWATAQRTFVSHTGIDTNPCTVDNPCRSFAAAIAVTNADGEVVAIDSAGYGTVTITQAVTIVAPLGVHAGISVFSGDGVTISAGSTDVIVLRNLYINAQGGVNGVTFTAGHALHIEHCVISGFSSSNININSPSVSAEPVIAITDTVIRGASQSGIHALSGFKALVSIDRCRLELNGSGVWADSNAFVVVSNSVADSTGNGFLVNPTTSTAIIAVESSVMSNSSSAVLVFTGGTATVHNSTSLHNTLGYFGNGGNLSLDHCVASGGQDGVRSLGTSIVSVASSTIADNSANGVFVASGVVVLNGNTIVRNNIGVNNAAGTVHSSGDNVIDSNATNTAGTIGTANKA